MKRILFALTIILILLSSVVPVSAERDLRVGDVVDINGMKATIVGFQGKQPIYQSIIYPNIYSSTSDGIARYSVYGETYNNTRTSATATIYSSTNYLGVEHSYSIAYTIERTYLYFDTSVFSGYVITGSSINLYTYNPYSYNNESIQVQSGQPTYPHDPLVTGDYDLTKYAGDGGSKTISTFSNGGYTTIALNATGYGWINTSGTTKYCLRTTGDINGITPTGQNYVDIYSSNHALNKPYLSVTYTAIAPVIISVAASSVATTSARLNSSITDDGGDPTCQIEFGYGLVSQTAVNYAAYTTHTSVTVPISDYAEGTNPYLDISGLASGTPYFYRVKITNEFGSVVSVDEQTFTTEAGVSAPSIFNGIPNDTNINLSFVRGTGSTQTLIRFATDTYPATTADGTQIYLDTGSNYIHSGLTGGTTYYYSAWGKSGANYSASAINLAMTTTDSLGDNDLPAAGAIGGLMQEPNETFLVHLQPFYSVLNGLADTWGMPRGNMWLALVLIFIFLVCGGLYIRFHSASLSLILMAMLMGGFVTLHILPTLFVIVIGFCILGAWATRPSL